MLTQQIATLIEAHRAGWPASHAHTDRTSRARVLRKSGHHLGRPDASPSGDSSSGDSQPRWPSNARNVVGSERRCARRVAVFSRRRLHHWQPRNARWALSTACRTGQLRGAVSRLPLSPRTPIFLQQSTMPLMPWAWLQAHHHTLAPQLGPHQSFACGWRRQCRRHISSGQLRFTRARTGMAIGVAIAVITPVPAHTKTPRHTSDLQTATCSRAPTLTTSSATTYPTARCARTGVLRRYSLTTIQHWHGHGLVWPNAIRWLMRALRTVMPCAWPALRLTLRFTRAWSTALSIGTRAIPEAKAAHRDCQRRTCSALLLDYTQRKQTNKR